MTGRLFGKLFSFLLAMFQELGSFLYDTAQNLFELIFEFFIWLGQLLERLFQSLIDVLVSFFVVIYELIECLLYLIYMIGVLAVKLFILLFAIAKLLWAFIVGLGRTIASLTYTPAESANHGYSEMMGQVAGLLGYLQIDVIAYILLFGIWLFTAFAVIRIFSTLRGGLS